MIPFEATLRAICRDLVEASLQFAIDGGLAVSARTEPRFTRDADLAVAVGNDPEAEDLIRTLRGRGYVVDSLLEQTVASRIATVRLRHGVASLVPVIDLLFASSGIEHEVIAAAESIELLPALHVPVATIGHLIALKVLSRDDEERPQDLIDLRMLRRVASPDDLTQAKRAVGMIVSRGYNRGRDLEEALRRLGLC